MSDTSEHDQIEAAKAYEHLHVPAIFEQWAYRVSKAARIGPGDRVLDVACGTGVLAREVVSRVGPSGHVAGVDPGPGMLVVAKRLEPSVEWRPGVAESLPFPDESFDAVVSQFGLMFFSDRRRALQEMLRVLKPGGRLAVAAWASLDDSEAYPIEVELLDRLGGQAAGDALRAPFVMGDVAELSDLFESAGVASVAVESVTGRARFPSIRTMVEADLRGWLPVMGVVLDEPVIQQILEEAEAVLSSYVTEDGQVVFDSPANIVTGSRTPLEGGRRAGR